MKQFPSKISRHQRRGSVLLLVLWALMVLSTVVFAWVKMIQQDISIIHQANSGLDAKALAHSGARVAMHPNVLFSWSPLLARSFGPGRSYKVKMTGEGGKLHLNGLLQLILAGQGQKQRLLLENYLARRGLSMQERATLIDSMLDWIQPGNLHHLNGMEDSATYKNAHRPFFSLDEVEKVNGSGPLVSQADWKDDFTLYSDNQAGLIDVNWASLRVLESIPEIGDARARLIINSRQGLDHIDGTKDDQLFKTAGEVWTRLGFGEPPANTLVTVGGKIYHISSVGQSGDVTRRLEVIADKSNPVPVILYWKEI